MGLGLVKKVRVRVRVRGWARKVRVSTRPAAMSSPSAWLHCRMYVSSE